MKNGIAVLCAATLLLHAQQQPPFALVVLRGDNAQNNIKKGRATKQVVEVRDRNNKPVAGVLLTFSLPKTGASGTFVDGSQLATVTTDTAGQASVTVQPNSVAGTYQIDVSGNVAGSPVNGKITQTNVAAAAGMSGATVGILAAVAAGAAVGIGLAVAGNGSSSSSPSTPPGVRIGVGSGVSVTAPR